MQSQTRAPSRWGVARCGRWHHSSAWDRSAAAHSAALNIASAASSWIEFLEKTAPYPGPSSASSPSSGEPGRGGGARRGGSSRTPPLRGSQTSRTRRPEAGARSGTSSTVESGMPEIKPERAPSFACKKLSLLSTASSAPSSPTRPGYMKAGKGGRADTAPSFPASAPEGRSAGILLRCSGPAAPGGPSNSRPATARRNWASVMSRTEAIATCSVAGPRSSGTATKTSCKLHRRNAEM
mmetsp:Transcript_48262/g.137988  ORF Transcript_48262/g.137988 Transcript_48262/m.137988 type:complete len:238 (+) Transcript_48262:752-1465(+)